MTVCEHVKAAISALPKHTHPMSGLIAGVNVLAAEYIQNGKKRLKMKLLKTLWQNCYNRSYGL